MSDEKRCDDCKHYRADHSVGFVEWCAAGGQLEPCEQYEREPGATTMHTDDMNDLILAAIDRGECPADPWDEINMLRAENARLRKLIHDMDIEHEMGWWSRSVRERLAALGIDND